MPTTQLTYDSTISSNWDTDIANIAADDGTMAGATSVGRIAIVAFTNLPAAAHTINSINYVLVDTIMNSPGKTDETRVVVTLQDSSGDFYAENAEFVTRNYNRTGTSRTTSDGSTAWTLSQINDIRLKLNVASANPNLGAGIQLDYAYIEVDYNLAPIPTYPNTSHRIIMDGGNVILDRGTIILD